MTEYNRYRSKSQQRSNREASKVPMVQSEHALLLTHLPGDWRPLLDHGPWRGCSATLMSLYSPTLLHPQEPSDFTSQDERDSRRFWGHKAALRGLSAVCVQVTAVQVTRKSPRCSASRGDKNNKGSCHSTALYHVH